MARMNKAQKEKVLKLFAGWDEDYAVAFAERVRRAVSEPGGKIYCRVDSRKYGLESLNHTPFRRVFADRNRVENSGGVYISGCGMDMLFEATYRLYCFFYPYGRGGQSRQYQKHLNRYKGY